MKIQEKKIYYELYEKKFGKVKHIPIGIECQVDPKNIPLITDLLENPQIYENDQKKLQQMTQMWDCERLHPDIVQYYLNQIKKLWPYQEYYF